MINNLIDAELPVEAEEQAVQMIRSAEALFPFLTGVDPNTKKRFPKMGKKSLDFVERSLMHARENRNLVPPFVDIDQFERDYRLMIQMRRVLSMSESFTSKLKHTYFLISAEAFSSAREFYNAVKRAARSGVLGSDTIKIDLAARYKKSLSKEDEPPGDTQVQTKE